MNAHLGMIVVHRGRAHVDDFLAACVCLHKTSMPLFRMDADSATLDDPSCWVLDQGMRFEPHLHNFDHHHLAERICSLTMVLDYFYDASYRLHFPQLAYIEIHDSAGSSKAGRFAGLPYEGLEISSSLMQHLLLKSFSKIEGRVEDPFASIMSSMGGELCGRIEELPMLISELDNKAKIIDFYGFKVLDVTNCLSEEPDRLPTKSWCEVRGIAPSLILTRDSRKKGQTRMVSVNKSIRFIQNPDCKYTHPSGFLTVFEKFEDWERILLFSVNQKN